jgi:transcriptional regulator with XRE-family HTH domain
MVERILEVLKVKNLSPSQFADEIGVQRSNISHLVSGRNKPSLEFIQKIIKRFPDISPEYLLSGQGDIYRGGSQTSLELAIPSNPVEEPEAVQQYEKEKVTPARPIRRKVPPPTDRPTVKFERTEKIRKEGEVEKIVYFFKDKTFTEYFPEDD